MKKLVFISFLLGGIFGATSCEDALQEEVFDFLSPSALENSPEGANFILQGVYSTLNSEVFQYDVMNRFGNMDEDHVTGPTWILGGIGSGNFTIPGEAYIRERTWGGYYKMVHRANVGIEAVEKMTFDEERRKDFMGHFQFLKAYAYFKLVTLYGKIPLMDKSLGAGADSQQPRQDLQKVYTEIIDLLKKAEGNLYKRNNPNFVTGRISKGGASALLVKVYSTIAASSLANAQVTFHGGPARNPDASLKATPNEITVTKKVVAGYEVFNSAEYFKLARDKAKEVMQGGEFVLFPTFMENWTVANRNKGEHIWMLQALTNGNNGTASGTNNWYLGYVNAAGEIANGRWVGCRDHWYELFEDDKDERVVKGVMHRWNQWGSINYYPPKHAAKVAAKDPLYGYTGAETYYADRVDFYKAHLTKFGAVSDNKTDRDDFHFPLLRYADIVLLYAEAENEVNGGPNAEAYAALNSIRKRSKASEVSGLNQQRFRSFVIEERARELALEQNRRWDLIRWGIYLDAMNAIGVDENNITKRREEKNLLMPVPEQEIITNKNFGPQNPGW